MTIPAERTDLIADMKGIEKAGDYATPGTDKLKVQALIDLIVPDATMTHRGHLDQMSPTARIQLLVELEALYTAVT